MYIPKFICVENAEDRRNKKEYLVSVLLYRIYTYIYVYSTYVLHFTSYTIASVWPSDICVCVYRSFESIL